MAVIAKVATYWRLGLFNVAAVAAYRIKLKLGYFKRLMPIEDTGISSHEFFVEPEKQTGAQEQQNLHEVTWLAFGWHKPPTDAPVNWHASILSPDKIGENKQHWSDIGDFDNSLGDIKTVWEASRFGWLFPFAIDFLKSQDKAHLDKLNNWLSDWHFHNKANQGVNWKCGQECSIRVLHLAATSYLLSQHENISQPLTQTIEQHLKRIAPTIGYAKAQDNNHGTSEACALICGALLLLSSDHYTDKQLAKKWLKAGRAAIENRVNKLIASDGCFSQNSVNYHRLMLDTVSLTEFFRQEFGHAKFSHSFYHKMKLATKWLAAMIASENGEAPILGLNDGAQLFPVTSCDYTDFRPSVHWANSLFVKPHDRELKVPFQQLAWLFPASEDVNKTEVPISLSSDFHILHNENWQLYLRTPTATFRPAQCDSLHLDAWCGNDNILLSTGSYSYNCEPKWQDYFPSVVAQNTVQLDQKEQMPRLSRFLFSNWIKTRVETDKNSIKAAYQNTLGHQHARRCAIEENKLMVIDEISGFDKQATLRWHLPQGNWQVSPSSIANKEWQLAFDANVEIKDIRLVEGWQSRYYLKKQPVSVVEVTIEHPGIITTIVSKH